MGERVVAQLVPFSDRAAQQFRMVLAVGANDEEGRRHAGIAQGVENQWRGLGIGPVVESQDNPVRSALPWRVMT
jgi:hypothetical protein